MNDISDASVRDSRIGGRKMRRFALVSLAPAGVLLAVVPPVLGPPRVAAQQRPGPTPPPLPPQSHAHGKTLTEWMKLLNTRAQGGDQGDGVKSVRFLPALIPVTDDPRLTEIDGFPYYVDEFDVKVSPGTTLAVAVLGVFAETYNPDGGQPADDIHDP